MLVCAHACVQRGGGRRGGHTDKDSDEGIMAHIGKHPQGVSIRKPEAELPLGFEALTHLQSHPP